MSNPAFYYRTAMEQPLKRSCQGGAPGYQPTQARTWEGRRRHQHNSGHASFLPWLSRVLLDPTRLGSSLPIHSVSPWLPSSEFPFLLQMISFDFQWLQPRPIADSGTNRIVKDSSNQVDLTVSASGGSAAIFLALWLWCLLEPKTLHFDIMNWNKMTKRKVRTVLE